MKTPSIHFGPFNAISLDAEQRRQRLDYAYSCVRLQMALIGAACFGAGLVATLFVVQLARYDRAIALCGV